MIDDDHEWKRGGEKEKLRESEKEKEHAKEQPMAMPEERWWHEVPKGQGLAGLHHGGGAVPAATPPPAARVPPRRRRRRIWTKQGAGPLLPEPDLEAPP